MFHTCSYGELCVQNVFPKIKPLFISTVLESGGEQAVHHLKLKESLLYWKYAHFNPIMPSLSSAPAISALLINGGKLSGMLLCSTGKLQIKESPSAIELLYYLHVLLLGLAFFKRIFHEEDTFINKELRNAFLKLKHQAR